MKYSFLIAAALSAAAIQSVACEHNVMFIGQSNAVNTYKQAKLLPLYDRDGCKLKLTGNIHAGWQLSKFKVDETNAKAKSIHKIVFWQGESDAYKLETASNWGHRADAFLNETKKKYGVNSNIPVIVVALNTKNKTRPYWCLIREQQFLLAKKKQCIIDTKDYPFLSDNVHTFTEVYKDIWLRVALSNCR